jgi:hypothetical protein
MAKEPRSLPAVPTRPVSGAAIATTWGTAVHDALFGAASIPDVRDGWRVVDAAANQAKLDMPRGDGSQSPLAGFNGSIVGFWYRLQGSITSGTLNIGAQAGSTVSPDTVLSAGATLGVVMLATPIAFTPTTAIRMFYSTVSLAPITVDISSGLIVRYDYTPG